jgi:hypothetical protein
LQAIQKYCLLLFFFLAAHLPIQDVSGDAQTHISAAIIIFGSYYAHFGPVIYTYYWLQAQTVHTKTQKYIMGSTKTCLGVIQKRWIGPRADMDEKNQYCLPAIRTLCLFNVVCFGALLAGYWEISPLWTISTRSGLGLLQGQVCDALVIPKGSWCIQLPLWYQIKSNPFSGDTQLHPSP